MYFHPLVLQEPDSAHYIMYLNVACIFRNCCLGIQASPVHSDHPTVVRPLRSHATRKEAVICLVKESGLILPIRLLWGCLIKDTCDSRQRVDQAALDTQKNKRPHDETQSYFICMQPESHSANTFCSCFSCQRV